MRLRWLIWLGLLCLYAALAGPLRAQDLYDPSVLRSFHLTFHDEDWQTRLRDNFASQTLILADLEVDGLVYPNVGVRIRGNTSYTALPADSEKFSLKIRTDHVDPNQQLMGYDNLNLNNGFRDPSFLREVVYNNFVAQFIPHPLANHVQLSLNGENWGVYVNTQQPNKRMLRDDFTNADGLRVICANRSFGPGLRYNGTDPSGYSEYEIQDDGGLEDPLGALIAVTDVLTNEPQSSWQNIDHWLALDPSIWSVVLENLLTDDDGYVSKGCDFVTYRDPIDGRMHLLQRDGNETFTQPAMPITRNFTSINRPLLNRVHTIPDLRQRYLAHYRTVQLFLNWSYFGPIFEAQRDLIDAAVQADPKRIYSYELFQQNFSQTVTLPFTGLGGGTVPGLQQFVDERSALLNANAELLQSSPSIHAVEISPQKPQAGNPVWIQAEVAGNQHAIDEVVLYYRPDPTGVYQQVPMLDDGEGGDAQAGDGIYGVLLPVSGEPGQLVSYYIAARSDNAQRSLRFFPPLAERGPEQLEFGVPAGAGMRITEWMYSGASGEFVEFTNLSAEAIDMSGWSMDDDHNQPGAFDLSAFGTVEPGESVLLTESEESAFRADWGLAPSTKVIGLLGVVTGNNLGRNDQIHLYDAQGVLQDRLYYGDQTYPGTIRTQTRSGQAGCAAIGLNQVELWVLAVAGDEFGAYASTTGDQGSPGLFIQDADCANADILFADGFEN